jgi:hypothetical protein
MRRPFILWAYYLIADLQLPIANCLVPDFKLAIGNRKSAMLQTLRRFGGRQPLCGIGVVSRIVITRMPAFAIALIADSRPPPGPFTRTSHWCIPASCAFLAASYAACCAANGVPLREPRKPRAPADDCAIKFPSRSVIEIIVLLNDAAICTMPLGTFFFSFLRKTFFFPPAFAITLFFVLWSLCFVLRAQLQSSKHKALSTATTSCPAPSSSRSLRVADLYECERSCAFAGRAPEAHGDGANHDNSRYPSTA